LEETGDSDESAGRKKTKDRTIPVQRACAAGEKMWGLISLKKEGAQKGDSLVRREEFSAIVDNSAKRVK